MLYVLFSALLLISLSLVTPIYSQEPNAVSQNLSLEEYACIADGPESFKSCLTEAKTTGVPFIKITAPIICESRNDCSFTMTGLRSFLKISPTLPENKFIRKSDFGYSLISVDDSVQIEFTGLTFEDQSDTSCPGGTTCQPFVSVKTSNNIKFDKVSFVKTQGVSLKIIDSRDISILGSSFKESDKSAVEISAANFTEKIKIENNQFENNAGTALVFQSNSIGSQSTIGNNKFINNHSKGAYSNCIYPCTGAQLKVTGPTSNLKISNNIISGGINSALDSLGLYSSGIEVGGQNINNTSLYCNEISGNRGSGIVQSPPFINISSVTISENKLSGNGLNLNIPSVQSDDTNCYTESCKLSCMPS